MKSTRSRDAAARRRPVVRVALCAARVLVAATALAVAMILSACGDSGPLATGGNCSGEALTVGSATFPESETVTDVDAKVLRAFWSPA
ncbi:hypothetical protein [Nocardia barduliensis]|uniref:hypothetical protein n=1 Tax=Nocardia barduliensis TaxID=2736643 RepID=UPI001573494C|nr:hypothetical protein [Nocardia barduliensis]